MAENIDHAVEGRDAFQHHEAVLQVCPGLEHPTIPIGDLAKGQAGETVAALVDQKVKMPRHEAQTILVTRSLDLPIVQLGENPRIE